MNEVRKKRYYLDERKRSAHILPPSQTGSLQQPVDVLKRLVDLLLPLDTGKIALLVAAALAGALHDIAGEKDGLRVVAQVAPRLASAGTVDVLEFGHCRFSLGRAWLV